MSARPDIADLVLLRDRHDGPDGDLPFIANSWVRHYAHSSTAKMIDPTIYFEEQSRLIDRLAQRSRFVIAANRHDPRQIFGWLCGERVTVDADRWAALMMPVVHYLYVKDAYRGFGIGRRLVAEFTGGAPLVFTHAGGRGDMRKLLSKIAPAGATFNPYLAWRP